MVDAELNGVQVYSSRHGVVVSNATVNFNDCSFSTNPVSGSGIVLDHPSTIAVTRCLIVNNKYGIISKSKHHMLNITDCILENNTANAIHLVHTSTGAVTPATLLLHRNLFSDNLRAVHVDHRIAIHIQVEAVDNVVESPSVNSDVSRSSVSISGLYINIGPYYARNQAHVVLQRNSFQHLPYSAVSISICYYYRLGSKQSIALIGNKFTAISQTAVVIQCADSAITLIQSNTFLQNQIDTGTSCLSISSRAVDTRSSVELTIDHNEFRDNSGTYVASFAFGGSSFSPGGVSSLSEFVSNTLFDNFPQESSVYSEYSGLPMHFNTFSNQRATFELRVGFPPDQEANCTYNWWGVDTTDAIAARILDHSDMDSVGSVVFVPFLNSSQFDCDKLSDCSDHGSCVYHDTCLCDAGWSGVDCSSYSCLSIYDCSNQGQCVGPNFCRCDTGWLQPDCSKASCVLQNNCSNRGVCSLPNM